MNTKDILKYAAFAVAGYLVYRYARDAGWFTSLGLTPAAPTPTTTPVTTITPAVTTTPVVVTAPPATTTTTPPVAETNDQIMAEAAPSGSSLRLYLIQEAAMNKTSLPMPAGSGTYNPVAVVRGLGLKYNSDGWNYYRAQGGGDVPNVDLFPEGNRDYQMTIDEYLQARTAHSLSGLSAGWHQLAHMQSASPWIC
jgi:hypothetical protein